MSRPGEFIVKERKLRVHPVGGNSEKYHGVVRELPRVDLDRTNSSFNSSFNRSQTMVEPNLPPSLYLEELIKKNKMTVMLFFVILSIICVSAQIIPGSLEKPVEIQTIIKENIVPDFSPMEKRIEELKEMVAAISKKQVEAELLITDNHSSLDSLGEMITDLSERPDPSPVTTAPTAGYVLPAKIEDKLSEVDFEKIERSILDAMGEKLENLEERMKDNLDEFEERSNTFLAEVLELAKQPHIKEFASSDCASSSDENIPFLQNLLEEKLRRFDADRTGMADFALESAGAEIIHDLTSKGLSSTSPILSIWKMPLLYQTMSPRIALTPGVHPGNCFAYNGDSGTLGIKLSQPIIVQNVTIQHIPKETAPLGHIESAPRGFEFIHVGSTGSESLGTWEFDQGGRPIQTFQIKGNAKVSRAVQFQFTSNWGAEHTCIYRVRVHGSLSHMLV